MRTGLQEVSPGILITTFQTASRNYLEVRYTISWLIDITKYSTEYKKTKFGWCRKHQIQTKNNAKIPILLTLQTQFPCPNSLPINYYTHCSWTYSKTFFCRGSTKQKLKLFQLAETSEKSFFKMPPTKLKSKLCKPVTACNFNRITTQ